MNSPLPLSQSDQKLATSRLVRATCMLAVFLSWTNPVSATEAMLIGGGTNVQDSSVRFEFATRWTSDVLAGQGINVTTYFTDGEDAGLDVYDTPENPQTEEVSPLMRVFGNGDRQIRRYRQHQIKTAANSTQSTHLIKAFRQHLTSSDDEELLLGFSGYGYLQDQDQAAIRLWNNSSINVEQLHSWLKQHNRSLRFVFPQSHSGGFHRLAYRHPVNGLELQDNTLCGFSATSTYGLAEIDSVSANQTSHPHYAGYFFAAISGYEPDGEIISHFADLDGNGITSLREAHFYALEEAISVDLPMSTSEDYLIRWQPWYLRWQPAPKQLPNNEYARIFRDVASRLGVSMGNDVAAVIRQQQALVAEQIHSAEQLDQQQQASAEKLTAQLRQSAINRWPSLAEPFSTEFETLVSSGAIKDVNTFISTSQPAFSQLTALQDKLVQNQWQILEMRRKQAQYQKLLYLRHIALLKQQIGDHGSSEQLKDYRRLLACEEQGLLATTPARPTVVSEDTTQ